MSRKIIDIYKEYKILSFLQTHMFRVTAVASLICDNLGESVNKEEIISACLIHDMGNIIKMEMHVFPEVFNPEGIEYWEEIKKEYIAKYGKNESEANVLIAKELVSNAIVELVVSFGYPKAVQNMEGSDWGKKICIYSDMRVAPLGVLSLRERIDEGRKRYAHRKDFDLLALDRIKTEEALFEIEKQIFKNCKIKPEDITDAVVAPIIEELKNFVIK